MKKIIAVLMVASSLQGCIQYVAHTGYDRTMSYDRACRSAGGTPDHLKGALGQPVVLKCKFSR